MADYKVDSIADVRIADDPSSVRVAVVAGAEQVVLRRLTRARRAISSIA